MEKFSIKRTIFNILNVVIIYILTTLLCYVSFQADVDAETLLMFYLLGILIVIIETKSFLITVFSTVLFILTHDFLFIEPHFAWGGSKNFIVSSVVFFVVALIVNLLVIRLQSQIKSSKENARLHKKLYEASEGLLSVHGKDKVIEYSDKALTELAGAEVEFYFDVDGSEKNEAIKWCFKNSAKCGHKEAEFPELSHKYIPIRSNNKTVGVVSIDCSEKEMSSETEKCITALLSQITIAIEREDLTDERKEEEKTLNHEHIVAGTIKSLSREMSPFVSSISKETKSLKENINLLEETEINEKLQGLEDNSSELTRILDNLIDLTKDE